MSRADRWWRPAPRRNVRPGVRARRHVVTEGDVIHGFGLGYDIGQADERKRYEERERKFREREEQLQRLADASEAASNGDPGPMDELAREWGLRDDDDLAVADAAGVTPLGEVDGDQLAAEVERWLTEQGGGE